MSNNKKLVPKRRFKKFKKIEEWKLSYLGDLLEFYSGLTYSPKNIVEKGGTLVLRSSNVKDCELVLLDKVYVDSIYVNSEFVRYGDIIVVVRNGSKHLIGKHALIKKHIKNTVIGAFMTGIRYKIPEFMNSLLDTKRFHNEIEKNLGATINQITIGHFRKMMFYIPDDIEQKDIGAFFSKLDTLIQTQQKKLDKTKTLKSAYLAEMFPCDSELKPKLQFKDFINDWYSIKLGKVGHAISGIGFPNSEQGGVDGIPFYKVSDMNNAGNEREMKHANNYVTSEQIFIRRWNTIKTLPAIIFAKVGAAIMLNRKRIIKTECIIDNNMMAYIFDHTWDVNFGKVLFETINLPRYAQVGALPSYNSTDIENIDTKVPNKDEQTKIGNFFKLLDKKIALEQRKLEKLNNIKQAYLNEMFV